MDMEERSFGTVRFIPGENRGRYPYSHSVYIEGAGILIDPASSRERLARLRDTEGVNAVWLSHWHEDHFTYLDLFHDVPLFISEADAPPLSDIEVLLDWYGVENNVERDYWKGVLIDHFHFKPRKPSGFLVKGEMELGLEMVSIIPTPGHTPGHLAFFFPTPGVIFMGDYDLTSFGPWYGDRGSSIEETVLSIRQLKDIPAKVWLTGHDTGVFEKPLDFLWSRYEGVIYERERKLIEALKTSRTMEEIIGLWIMYGKPREPKAFFEFGERVLVKKHLQFLMKKEVILHKGGKYFLA
jgi:glyoxylase-like metal-dependent hydrolase (beta-lactamase superfamily II)